MRLRLYSFVVAEHADGIVILLKLKIVVQGRVYCSKITVMQ